MKLEEIQPQLSGVQALEPIAMAALDAGRLMMEAGASAAAVDHIVATVARGLGAERVDLRVGYASLAITIGIGGSGITRMRKVGPLGVNQRVDQAVRSLALRVSQGTMDAAVTNQELAGLTHRIPRHSAVVTAIAVGFACAAFGRLLGVDWAGTGPVLVSACIGQLIRRELVSRHVNIFILSLLVSFLGAVLGGLGARWAGSETVATAMVASILLMVPGVPALNAQYDILDGRPTLGSARAVWVIVVLVFMTVGLWLGQAILQEGH
jgi:uncharacterized membrane protein YjjP (DUF1212 family)